MVVEVHRNCGGKINISVVTTCPLRIHRECEKCGATKEESFSTSGVEILVEVDLPPPTETGDQS